MNNDLYRIYWHVKKDPSKNMAGQLTTKNNAESCVSEMNAKYPELHHWAVKE